MLPRTITGPKNSLCGTTIHTPQTHIEKGHKDRKHLSSYCVSPSYPATIIHAVDPTDRLSDVIKEAIQNVKDTDIPIIVMDVDDVILQYETFRKLLPRVTPYYAVKCNPDPIIIQILSKLGCRFDCASLKEIELVRDLCINNVNCKSQIDDLIIYANPIKMNSHIIGAKEIGVSLLVADSLCELSKLADIYPGCRVLLRMACADSSSQCPMSGKFGAVCDDIIKFLLPRAIRLGLNVQGIAYHVGSGCSNLGSLVTAVIDAHKIFKAALENHGLKLSILDIGGGFPGGVHKDLSLSESTPTFSAMANLIRDTLDIYFPEEYGIRIIAEPGRFFASSPATLITKIICKNSITIRTPEDTNSSIISYSDIEEHKVRYHLNDGIYGSFNCVVYDHQKVWPQYLKYKDDGCDIVPILMDSDTDCSSTSKYPKCILFGPTCDGFDTIIDGIEHLPDMKVGGYIYWENMGAYTSAASTQFNGFDLAVTWYYTRNTDIIKNIFQ